MKIQCSILFLILGWAAFSQDPTQKNKSLVKSEAQKNIELAQKAPIDLYTVISIQNDSTYIDTTLTIQKEYKFNYLRKDLFGLLPFSNDGQTYNNLQFLSQNQTAYPDFGFQAKQFNYLKTNDINYYSVPTPLTELFYKTAIQQGQNLDSFITINTSPQFNFSIAYKGLRSLGNYLNQLSSTGNFRATASYNSKKQNYSFKTHFVAQDISNQENGGIVNRADFENGDNKFSDRARLQVYLADAKSLLEGKRFFAFQSLRLNTKNQKNNLFLNYKFTAENKYFVFTQPTVASQITTQSGATTYLNRFGSSYVSNNINDKTSYQNLIHNAGLSFENIALGKIYFGLSDFKYHYFYNNVLVINGNTIPNEIKDHISSFETLYKYQKDNWNAVFEYSNSITKQDLSHLDLKLEYNFDDDNQLAIGFQKTNKLPNHVFNLFQSAYTNYNWKNDFKNEKIVRFHAEATTKWLDASLEWNQLTDRLFFENTSLTALITLPKQFEGNINLAAVKIEKEISFRKFSLNNTVLYQKVAQSERILNVPELVLRHSLYYSDVLFKKAMNLQTGFTLHYFSRYTANEYNPVLGEFFVQSALEIGNFPVLDFFVNAKIKQTRIYLKAEHFNAAFSKSNYYASPNNPLVDFTIRFGLVWNFFQ